MLKIQLKITSLALVVETFTELSYLLAIVQLTRQVGNGWFSPVFLRFLIEFINIEPVYIRWCAGGARGGVGGGKSLIKEE